MRFELLFPGIARKALLVAGISATGAGLSAAPVMLNFEGFPDSTILASQYPGVTFTNAIILTAGISLNEFGFPPHSGTNDFPINSSKGIVILGRRKRVR